jgi:GTP-binding protein YchF
MTTVLFARASKSHNLSMGIVGLPNIGKSTLFNILTKNGVPADNYPFCTKDPNIGQVENGDERVDVLASKYMPRSVVKAYLSVTDIAGLVRGASEGTGLGNQFLDHIRNVDGIFHVVRCFEDTEVAHFEDSVDPIRDIETVNEELRLKDLEVLTRYSERVLSKELRAHPNDMKMKERAALVQRLLEILKRDWVNKHTFSDAEVGFISTLNLLTTKNVVYLANVSKEDYERKRVNKHLRDVVNYTRDLIVFSAAYEAEHDNKVFVNKLIKKGYDVLHLINFFTVGKDEVKSWTIRRGTAAPSAGGVIHSDFRDSFMSAEVMSYEDFVRYGSEAEVRKAGRYLKCGKQYVVNDGDMVLFKHNPPRSGARKH